MLRIRQATYLVLDDLDAIGWMLSPTSGSHWSEGPLEGLLTRAVPMSCNRHLLMKRILARGGDCRAGFYHPP